VKVSNWTPGIYRASLIQIDGVKHWEMPDIARLEVAPFPFEATLRADIAAKYLTGSGIEIGALQRPLLLPARCRVKYIDRLITADLRNHYPELNVHPLTTPDIVDDGERLHHIANESQDFVIANHFLEHSQNPIDTINNLFRVLRTDGVLYMAIPDKRIIFDRTRPVTRFERLWQTYLSGVREDRTELYTEWCIHSLNLSSEESAQMASQLLEQDYSIHFNVWGSEEIVSFFLGIKDRIGLPFDILGLFTTDNELIVLLKKVGGPAATEVSS
jgi:SAM-dependent methyltransferase